MNQRGMTLIEVLIALGIFAAVSAIGVGALSLAASGSEQLDKADIRIGELERFRGLLRSDLYQLIDRPVREPDTDEPRPSLMGGAFSDELLEDEEGVAILALVRSGWPNPGAKEPRSELQAVIYFVQGDQILRRTRPFLDAVRETPHRDDLLLEGVSDVEIAFLNRAGWGEEAGRPGRGEEPVAVRIRFMHPHYGAMQHIFMLGGPE
ncbi:MAG: type II secretion system minor pseudopilin GspJ [Pseudomonadota bacterium]